MSVRLNVVVVQSPQMSSLQVGVVADVVIQLLGRPGIDVAMVASLQPEDEHTDRLMLTGLESDLAVIDWRSADQTLDSLAALGLGVRRAPHALDPDVEAVPMGLRRVYVFDLRLGFKADEVVHTLITLLQQRQVVTVPLSLPGGKRSMSDTDHVRSERPAPASEPVQRNQASSVGSNRPLDAAEQPRPHRPSRDQEADLDALVDSVNDIDL
ncbi:MAG: hypothetical protein ACO1RT_05000 [Planctomycetaceae bacterium]